MKATVKLILFLITFSFVACDKDEDDFSKKDSYLYVWNVRTWEVGKESKLSDIKVTYFFKGDTTRVQNINFWIKIPTRKNLRTSVRSASTRASLPISTVTPS